VQQRLPLQHRAALQALKVVLLVARVLVDDEQVRTQARKDEAQVELAQHAHAGKVGLPEHLLQLARRGRLRLRAHAVRALGGQPAWWQHGRGAQCSGPCVSRRPHLQPPSLPSRHAR
jgi:hypothetical protein